ncbi:MAG: major facilitator superfamily domain-containing protein [Linnemannia gamsii]|nr:MAG: major facilitator superfamily domain-containing protein [Linnemannia gamsii]
MLRFNDPYTQVIFLGFVVFCLPGMHNAISGMGAYGIDAVKDANVVNDANTALSVIFAMSSLVAGGLFNLFGHRWLLFFGGLSYTLYISSYFAYGFIHSVPFIVIAAIVLGLGAGCLWCAQGAIMMGYPSEGDKGKYFGLFWAIFNTGAVLGGFIPMGIQWNDPGAKAMSNTVFIVFLSITVVGAFLSLLLLPASKVVRADGTPITKVKFSSAGAEARAILALFKDWRMLALFPMFFTSNWFYSYQLNLNGLNQAESVRTRSFDSATYWGAQVIASLLYARLLDNPNWTRRTRARYGYFVLIAFLIIVYGGGIAFQSTIGLGNGGFKNYDMVNTTGEWIKFWLLFFGYGASDALFQGYAYWIMGALTNDIHVVARYVGFYKFAQNIGAVLSGQVSNSPIGNNHKHPENAVGKGMGEILICIAFIALSLICAAPVVFKAIQETSEETVEEEKQEYAAEEKA